MTIVAVANNKYYIFIRVCVRACVGACVGAQAALARIGLLRQERGGRGWNSTHTHTQVQRSQTCYMRHPYYTRYITFPTLHF